MTSPTERAVCGHNGLEKRKMILLRILCGMGFHTGNWGEKYAHVTKMYSGTGKHLYDQSFAAQDRTCEVCNVVTTRRIDAN